MKVDKQELLDRLNNLLNRTREDNVLTDDEEMTLIVAIAVIEAIEE